MTRLLTLLVVLAVAGGAGVFFILSRGNTPSELRDEDAGLGLTQAQSGPGPLEGDGAGAPIGSVSARSESQAILAPDPVTGEILDDQPADLPPSQYVARSYLIGRLVDTEGKPISGVELRLLGRAANLRRKQEWPGDLSRWEHLERRTDSQGRFAFAFRPLPPLAFTLESRDPRFLTWRKRWNEIEPGKRVELGDIELSVGGVVRGSLQYASGERIADGWKVRLEPESEEDRETIRRDPVRRPRGTFEIDGVAAGKWTLAIQFDRGMPEGGELRFSQPEQFTLKEGEEKEFEVTYFGPSLRSTITLSIDGPKVGGRPKAEHVRLIGGNAGVQLAGEPGEETGGHTWEGLSWASYRIEIDDPRFERWREEGVRPGPGRVTAKLKGSSSVAIRAFQARDGKEVTEFGVKIRPKPSESSEEETTPAALVGLQEMNLTVLSRTKTWASGVAEIDDLVAGDWILVVDSPNHTRAEIELANLAPGENREVAVPLTTGASIAGIVYESDGKTPLAGATVFVYPYGEEPPGDSMFGGMARRMRSLQNNSRYGRTDTDSSGRFVFENLEPGTYDVRARFARQADNMLGMMDFFRSGGAALEAVREGVSATERERVRDIALTMPDGAFFRGRVLGPPGADYKMVNLRLSSLDDGTGMDFDVEMSVSFKVDEEGAFDIGPLRPGSAKLTALLFDEEDLTSFGRIQEREIGTYVLSVGERTDEEIDLREIWPGTVRILVTRDGKPLEGARVSIAQAGEERRGFRRFGGERTNEKGAVFYEAVFAGALEVSVARDDWSYRHPQPIFLVPGGDAELEIRIVLKKAEIFVLDEGTGEALANRTFWVREAVGGTYAGDRVRSDERGRIELELTPGSYQLVPMPEFERRRPNPQGFRTFVDAEGVPFEWTAGGAVPGRLEFPMGPAKGEGDEQGEGAPIGIGGAVEGGGGRR